MLDLDHPKTVKIVELLFNKILQELKYNVDISKDELLWRTNEEYMEEIALVDTDLVEDLNGEIRRLNSRIMELEQGRDKELLKLQEQHDKEVAKLKRIIKIKNDRIIKLGGDVVDVGF